MSTSKSILVVEDEMVIALHMEDTLSDLGHQVVVASSVKEAERVLDAGGIELAVLDYHVTDGDTDQLMLRLHEAGVPFLVCSGLPGGDGAKDLFKENPVLAKPFTTESLVAAISALAGGRSSDDLH